MLSSAMLWCLWYVHFLFASLWPCEEVIPNLERVHGIPWGHMSKTQICLTAQWWLATLLDHLPSPSFSSSLSDPDWLPQLPHLKPQGHVDIIFGNSPVLFLPLFGILPSCFFFLYPYCYQSVPKSFLVPPSIIKMFAICFFSNDGHPCIVSWLLGTSLTDAHCHPTF